jgi:hypothetical protein
MELQKGTNLVRIPCGQNDLVTEVLQLLYNGNKKGDVQRIVQNNPDSLLPRRLTGAT